MKIIDFNILKLKRNKNPVIIMNKSLKYCSLQDREERTIFLN